MHLLIEILFLMWILQIVWLVDLLLGKTTQNLRRTRFVTGVHRFAWHHDHSR
jgi:hypothetical protein